MASVARSRELAVVIACAGTTSGRCVLNVGRKVTRATPTTSSTAISWFTERTPSAQASGTVSSAVAASRSAAIISGRPPQPVDPGADDQGEPDVRRRAGRREQPHLQRAGAEQDRRRHRDREDGDLAADRGDGVGVRRSGRASPGPDAPPGRLGAAGCDVRLAEVVGGAVVVSVSTRCETTLSRLCL
jgi:hypothetical protein